MLTRRDFLTGITGAIAALGIGIRPTREESVIDLSRLLVDPTNEQFRAVPVLDLLSVDVGEARLRPLSMPMLDNFGIDTAALRRSLQEST